MMKSDNTEHSSLSNPTPIVPPLAGISEPANESDASTSPQIVTPVTIPTEKRAEHAAVSTAVADDRQPVDERQGEIHQILDLKGIYPITFRRAFKKAFWRGVICAAMAVLYFASDRYLVPLLSSPEEILSARAVVGTLFVLSFIWWLGRVIYYQVERQFTEYRVEGGNLFLRRGLFVKETGSFPLSRITDIYLHRGWGDFFWGLSSLHVSTPTQSSGTFAYIHGLTIRNAEKLQRHLQELVKEHDYQLQMISGQVGSLVASAAKRQQEYDDAARESR